MGFLVLWPIFKRLTMINVVLGFFIALTVGLTGIGGGSFTVPALLLIVGMPAVGAVGTAFVFAAVLRLIAAPFYVFTGGVHSKYLRLLLIGAVPGLVLGMIALRLLSTGAGSPLVVIILGVLLAMSSNVTFIPRAQNAHFAVKNSRWLPWLALPIGIESGFSSAGAGSTGNPAAELFGNDAGAGGRHGYRLRTSAGDHWQRGALDAGNHQFHGSVATAGGRSAWGGFRLRYGSQSSRSKAEGSDGGDRHLRRITAGMVRRRFT